MSMFVIDQVGTDARHAGSKARADASAILRRLGFEELTLRCTYDDSVHSIVRDAVSMHRQLLAGLDRMRAGDTALLQFPYRCYRTATGKAFCRQAAKRGVTTVALVHDLDSLRRENASERTARVAALEAIRLDVDFLRGFDFVISHNERMSAYLAQAGIAPSKLVNLRLFDYLVPSTSVDAGEYPPASDAAAADTAGPAAAAAPAPDRVFFVGNLSADKAGFAYRLDEIASPECAFTLYGPGYTGTSSQLVAYGGTLDADAVPSYVKGGFGLVWDGGSLESCDGPFGEYLRYNNPHKASLYLACGIPLIVWGQSALASLVRSEGIGICIESLGELPGVLASLTEAGRREMLRCVTRVQSRVRAGCYLTDAVDSIFDCLS